MNIIMELYKRKNEHFIVNRSIINSFLKNQEDFKLLASREHLNCVAFDLSENKKIIHHNKSFILTVSSQISYRLHWYFSILSRTFGLFRLRQKYGVKKFVYLSSKSLDVNAAKICSRFLSIDFVFILHGDLADITRDNSPFSLKQALINARSNRIKFVVLERYIKRNLIKEIPFMAKKTFVYPLPILKIEKRKITDIEGLRNYKIGFFGYLDVNKNPSLIAQFIKYAKSLNIEVVCKFWTKNLKYDHQLEFSISREPFSESDKDEFMKSIDFIGFFHDEKHYQYSSSGVLSDAMTYQLPLVGLSDQVFLPSINNCKIGVFNDKLQALAKEVSELKSSQYNLFLSALSELARQRIHVNNDFLLSINDNDR